ncbi:ABC transporter permease [Mesorhizobium qingshengii]|uniref:ABC transporter permease n=1 Tax=Mesorhizobium qingshengii TaxID=1165689 RepID=A0ABT4QU25_9HYPH|nr:ABC transporter permease [Mesorhizobium qingshengii]MCZ8545085.1 ABC transporter permease [Mesorhizobium qingshengii]
MQLVPIIAPLIEKAVPYLLLGLAGLLGLWRLYRKGKTDQKAAQAAEEAKARAVADKVDIEVGALPADKVRQELKTWDPKQ